MKNEVAKKSLAVLIMLVLLALMIGSVKNAFWTGTLNLEDLQPTQQILYDDLVARKNLSLPIQIGSKYNGDPLYQKSDNTYTDTLPSWVNPDRSFNLSISEKRDFELAAIVTAPDWMWWEVFITEQIRSLLSLCTGIGICIGMILCYLLRHIVIESRNKRYTEKIVMYVSGSIGVPIILTALTTSIIPLLALTSSFWVTFYLTTICAKLWSSPNHTSSSASI
jgi:hypothetical protein